MIYPVFSPLRNLIPRTQGQGTSHQAKVITSISGALPGGLGTPSNRFSIPELPSGGGISGANWPNQLPASGTQQSINLNIPYKFFGLTEAVSWLAQFAGQGFDDAAGLASLILLQESMLLEERAMIASTSIAVSAPSVPGFTPRSPGTGEVAVTGVTTNLYVAVTALNYYGETVSSTITSSGWSSGDVVDVLISPVTGALAYNIYVGTGSSSPGNSGMHLMVQAAGATRVTLQGAIPTATATPPTADTGTSASTDYEGIIPVISGHSASGGSNVYPGGIQGSYVNQSSGDILSENLINTGLAAMWDGANGIFADPDDIWAEGSDLMRLAGSLANQTNSSNPNNYRFFINQNEIGGVQAGVAVSEFRNSITQKVVNLRVHPYIPQGTAAALSYKLSMPWSNTGNIWENVMVQDYLNNAERSGFTLAA